MPTDPKAAPPESLPRYQHTPLFPLGEDSTPYRKLTSAGVAVTTHQLSVSVPIR